MRNVLTAAVLTAAALTLVACEKKTAQSPAAPPATSASLPANFFLTTAPADAKPLEDVKPSAKPGDTVALRARIGGSETPFVDSRAVFTVVGPGIKACSDNTGDECKTPWDYCCESAEDIAAHAATVQVVDASGAPLKLSLKGQKGLKELSDLVVVGKVAQADGKILVVNATGLYISTN